MTTIATLVEQTESLLDRYHRAVDALCRALPSDDKAVFCAPSRQADLLDTTGREMIIHSIKQSSISKNAHSEACMAVGVCSSTLALAETVNAIKAQFKSHHCTIISESPNSVLGSRQWRDILGMAGGGHLCTKTIDRLIPIIHDHPAHFTWTHRRSMHTRKRTVADAITELQGRDPELHSPQQGLIDELSALSPRLPLFHRAAKHYHALHCRTTFFGDKPALSHYAKNPLIYLNDESLPSPAFTPPRPASQATGRSPLHHKGMPVSDYLPGWYYYRHATEEIETSKKKKHNDAAKTRMPNVWLEMRAGVVFAFRNKEGKINTANISRLGIEGAMAKMLPKLRDSHLTADDYDKLKPTPACIEAFKQSVK